MVAPQASADPSVQPRNPYGLLRVVSNQQLQEQEERDKAARNPPQPEAQYTGLAGYIKTQWDMMVRHRNTIAGWSDRLLSALRAFNGQYEPSKLAEIRKFGGSEVYARLTAAKCRGATALLRDVYLGADRSWGLNPPSDPTITEEVQAAIQQVVMIEYQQSTQPGPPDPATGQPTPPQPMQQEQMRDRVRELMESAQDAARRKSVDQTQRAEDKIDEILTEGNYYKAWAEILADVPLFPFGCLKGPTVRMVHTVQWQGNKAIPQRVPRLWWERVSPFDIWWSPGVADVEDAQMVERRRLTRADLNDCLDLPGYNTANIREVLRNYGTQGFIWNWDSTDASRSVLESRENPTMNMTNLLDCLEFHGNVQGTLLLEYGFSTEEVPDDLRDYSVEAWLIGPYLIKVQMNPSPRRRHNYYVTSWEKVPGTPVGNGIPDVLSDIQEVCNAALRSVVNNMSISSGPQVVVNDDRLAGQENSDELYPWKRWHVTNPTVSGTQDKAIEFFQPQSNAQENLGVFNAFYGLADDISAIPRYMSGNSPGGGAGRTSSGLAMLMGNASKLLQTVCANLDQDIVSPNLQNLFDMILLTDSTGILTGEEEVVPKGVIVAMQKETMRQRQLEFLQITANPLDMGIIGPKGRASVLRSVSQTIGLDGEEIVPSDSEMDEQQAMAKANAAMQGAPGHAQGPPGPGGPGGPAGPGSAAASPGAAAQGQQAPAAQQGGPRVNLHQQAPQAAPAAAG
jgi:hypothetical protein